MVSIRRVREGSKVNQERTIADLGQIKTRMVEPSKTRERERKRERWRGKERRGHKALPVFLERKGFWLKFLHVVFCLFSN